MPMNERWPSFFMLLWFARPERGEALKSASTQMRVQKTNLKDKHFLKRDTTKQHADALVANAKHLARCLIGWA